MFFLNLFLFIFIKKKDVMNARRDISIRFFAHGIKFYLKLLSNLYNLFDSIRIYEAPLLKTNYVDSLYENLFEFSINELKTSISRMNASEPSNNNANESSSKLCSLAKFSFLLLVHYGSVCLSNESVKENVSLNENLVQIESLISDKLISKIVAFENISVSEKNDIYSFKTVLNIFNLVISYNQKSSQFVSHKSKSITNSKVNSAKENSKLEIDIKNELKNFNLKSKDSFFQVSILHCMYEFIVNIFSNICHDQTCHTKYLNENFIDCFETMASLYMENSKVI
jgi:hypothetical protein